MGETYQSVLKCTKCNNITSDGAVTFYESKKDKSRRLSVDLEEDRKWVQRAEEIGRIAQRKHDAWKADVECGRRPKPNLETLGMAAGIMPAWDIPPKPRKPKPHEISKEEQYKRKLRMLEQSTFQADYLFDSGLTTEEYQRERARQQKRHEDFEASFKENKEEK